MEYYGVACHHEEPDCHCCQCALTGKLARLEQQPGHDDSNDEVFRVDA